MDRLPDEARQLLDQAKAAETPGAAERERVWAALEAKLALGGAEAGQAGGEQASADPAGAAGAASIGPGAKLTLALVGVGLVLAVGAGVRSWREDAAPPSVDGPASPAPADASEARSASPAGDPGLEMGSSAGPGVGGASPPTGDGASDARGGEAQEGEDEAPGDVPAAPGTGDDAARARPPGAAASSPAGDDIAADVALLHAAQSAWRAGRASEALRLAEQHRSAFPRSALGRERDAIRVLALCALGRDESARRIGARLLASSGASPWRQAVAESCGGR